MIFGINALRARSGGAVRHLENFVEFSKPWEYGFKEVHIWCNEQLSLSIPKKRWVVLHKVNFPKKMLLLELLWEKFFLIKQLHKHSCNILLNLDAGSLCMFKPQVTMSRDMLPFEPGEMEEYPIGLKWLRLILLKKIQVHTLNNSDGRIFLTNHAMKLITKKLTLKKENIIIPHGVSEEFRSIAKRKILDTPNSLIKCLYVSHFEIYKHQWKVVEAICSIRKDGYPISLEIVGGGDGPAKRLTDRTRKLYDPCGECIICTEYVNKKVIIEKMRETDIFVFASSCENMPNTIIEGMAAGLPIACSDCGPMPEVLQDGGVYFNPRDTQSIKKAILSFIIDKNVAKRKSQRALLLSKKFSWERCTNETLKFLANILELKK